MQRGRLGSVPWDGGATCGRQRLRSAALGNALPRGAARATCSAAPHGGRNTLHVATCCSAACCTLQHAAALRVATCCSAARCDPWGFRSQPCLGSACAGLVKEIGVSNFRACLRTRPRAQHRVRARTSADTCASSTPMPWAAQPARRRPAIREHTGLCDEGGSFSCQMRRGSPPAVRRAQNGPVGSSGVQCSACLAKQPCAAHRNARSADAEQLQLLLAQAKVKPAYVQNRCFARAWAHRLPHLHPDCATPATTALPGPGLPPPHLDWD
jgi:hypothetical protein